MRFNQIPKLYLCSGSLRSSLHCHLDTDNDPVLLYNGVILRPQKNTCLVIVRTKLLNRTRAHVGNIEMDLVSEHLRVQDFLPYPYATL